MRGGAAPRHRAATSPPADPQFRDFLDARGALPDPLTGQPRGPGYARARELVRWDKLPLYSPAHVRALVGSMRSNLVTVLVAGTGTGKTVLAPRIALEEALRSPARGAVAVTNPKRDVTRENARTAALILDAPLGGAVGYRVSGDSSAGPDTALLYTTDGYLVAASRSDPAFSRYAWVVIDEVHERPEPTDFLMLALRRAMAGRAGGAEPLRAMLVSATVDPARFVAYFEAAGLSVGVVEVPGVETHPVALAYRPTPQDRLVEVAADAALRHLAGDADDPAGGACRGSAIVFVPVVRDASKGCRALREACRRRGDGLDCSEEGLACVRLHSRTPAPDVERAVHGREPRVLFATNAAESSLTVPGLCLVVDTGLEFFVTYDGAADEFRTGKRLVTQAQARQRMGRVGRTSPGACLRLYPESELLASPRWPAPAILQAPMTDRAWAILLDRGVSGRRWSGVLEEAAQLLDPPGAGQMDAARSELVCWGLLDPDSGSPTDLGDALAALQVRLHPPWPVRPALALLLGRAMGATLEGAVLGAAAQKTDGSTRDLWAAVENRDGDIRQEPPKEVLQPGKWAATILACHAALNRRGAHKAREAARRGCNMPVWDAIELSARSAIRAADRMPDRLVALAAQSPVLALVGAAVDKPADRVALGYCLPRLATPAGGGLWLRAARPRAGPAAAEGAPKGSNLAVCERAVRRPDGELELEGATAFRARTAAAAEALVRHVASAFAAPPSPPQVPGPAARGPSPQRRRARPTPARAKAGQKRR